MNRYWVEVLLDDGELYGYPAEADNEQQAKEQAMQSARDWGFKPVEVDDISDFD